MFDLPSYTPAPDQDPQVFKPVPVQPNAIAAGLRSGTESALGTGAGALAAGAKALGANDTSAYLQGKAKDYNASAAAVGRPDLDAAPWLSGAFLPKLGYNVGKLIPGTAAAVGTGLLATAAIPAELPAAGLAGAAGLAARAGAYLPSFLGGGGGELAAARAVAGMAGAAVSTVPQSIGEAANAASEQPGGLTQGRALGAIAMGAPVGVAQTLVPGAGLFGRLGTGALARLGDTAGARFVEHGASNAAAGALGSGLQAAADLSFDQTKSFADKAGEIVDAVQQGAVTGGLMGGLAGVLRGKPNEIPNKSISDVVDAVVNPTPPLMLPPPNDTLRTMDGRIFDMTPRPQGPGAPDDIQQDLPLSAPFSVHAPGTQAGLFAPPLPYDPGVMPRMRTKAEARAEVKAQREAAAAAIAGRPAPEPAPPPPPEPVQQELPLVPPPDLARPGTQFNIFDPETYNAGTPPAPVSAAEIARANEARRKAGLPPPEPNLKQADLALRPPLEAMRPDTQLDLLDPQRDVAGPPPAVQAPEAAPVAPPARATLKELLNQPEPPPPNAYLKQAIASAPDIKTRSEGKSFKDFVANSTATNDAELYNELFRVSPDDKANAALVKSKAFTQLATRLGVGVPDLEGALVKAQAAPKPDVGEIRKLQAQIQIRDEAAKLRDTSAQAKPIAAPAAAPAQPIAAVQAPDDAISEHTAADLASKAAVSSGNGAAAAAERASPEIQTLGPHVTAPASVATDATAPRSIAQKVIDAAHSIQGVAEGGGQVDVATLRTMLPDVAPGDLDNALREIHGDDSDHTLVQNPKGQRTGVDGVTVAGQGRFHKLDVAPREGPDAVQVGGAASQALGDQPGGGQADGGGDAAGAEIARAGDTLGAEAGPSGAQEPAGQGTAEAPVDFQPVRDANGKLNPLPGETRQQTAARDKRLKAFGAFISSKDPFGENGRVDPTPDPVKAAATAAKLAPVDPAASSPEQEAQTSAKLSATRDMLTAPSPVKAAAKPIVAKLRKQARTKTAIVETPQGDQIPTAAIGADTPDLVQASATSTDPIVDAGPPEPMAKVPWRRAAEVVDTHPVMPRAQVDAHVDKFVAKLKPEIQGSIHVLDSADQLPKEIRDAMAAKGDDPDRLPGVYYKGQVYIRADQMRSYGEVEDVLSHEVMGHLANRTRLPNSSVYQSTMAPIFDRAGGFEGIEKLARKAGVWDENEAGGNLVGGAGLKAYMPPNPAKATPYEKTSILEELMAHTASTTPTALDRAIFTVQDGIRKAIVNTLRRAGMHNFAAQLDTFTRADLQKWVDDNRKALMEQPKPGQVDLLAGSSDPRRFLHDTGPLGEAPYMAKISSQQRDYQGLMGMVGSLRDRIIANTNKDELWQPSLKDRGVKNPSAAELAHDAGRAIKENMMPRNEIAESGKRAGIGTLMEHHELGDVEQNIKRVIDGGGNNVAQRHLELVQKDKIKGDTLNDLGPLANAYNVDPTRPFKDHTWLTGLNPEELGQRREVWEKTRQMLNSLGQEGKNGVKTDGQGIYRDMVSMGQMNSYMKQAGYLEHTLRTLFAGKIDMPIEYAKRFGGLDPTYVDSTGRQLAHDHYDNPQAMLAYWNNAFDTMHAAASAHLLDAKSRLASVAAAAKAGDATAIEQMKNEDALSRPYRDLEALLKQQKEVEDAQVKQGNYFHMGRTGQYAVGFKVKPVLDAEGNATETADPVAMQALADGFGKQFPQVSIGKFSANRQVFARFADQNTANRFAALVQDGGALRKHIDLDEGTHVSLLDEAKSVGDAVPALPALLDAASARFDQDLAKLPEGSDEYKALDSQRAKFLGGLRSALINLGADSSMRVMSARRMDVQGANADMMANQKAAWQTHSRAAAGMAVQAEKAKALADARQAITDMGKSQSQDALAKAVRAKRIFNAYQAANDAAGVNIDAPLLTRVKSFLHTFTLGGSPAYMVMALSQNPLLTFPELARFHSGLRTSQAMMKSLEPTARLLAQLTKTGNIFEGGITPQIVKDAGFNLKDQQEILRWVDRGLLEQGSYTNVNQGFGIGSMGRVEKIQHYANSTALGAELASRLVAAFSAKDLYENMPASKFRDSMIGQHPDVTNYVSRVVKQSMFEWGGNNTPRAFLAGGPLAKIGPLLGQFHGFTPRLLGMIYRNAMDGYTNRLGPNAYKFGPNGERILQGPDNDQLRTEARRFTNYHLAAVTALTGGLGLPMAGTGLALATRASGVFGDQPYDMEANLRGWLSETFGKDAGEILSRGLPRYLGIDTADLGDAGLAPLGRLLEDRRPFEDAMSDYLSHAWGSAPSLVGNAVVAMREMSEGRFAEAGSRALPTVLRNVARAYQVDKYGFVNSQGEHVPVEADATQVAKTALGFTDGNLAEERDKQENIANLKVDRRYRSGVIMRQIALANVRKDPVAMQEAMQAARKFDQDNPGQMLTASIPGFLASRGKTDALSRQYGVLGANPRDKAALDLTRY